MRTSLVLRASGIGACLAGILVILFGGVATPESFRIVNGIVLNLLVLGVAWLLLAPNAKALRVAFMIGVFTMVLDFLLETAAVHLHWWYPLGGTQLPPLVVVPLEMVVGFLIMGTATGIVLAFPQRIRETTLTPLDRLKAPFANPNRDWTWRLAFVLVVALVGTHGDYTAGPDIWAPGAHWHPAFTFFVWSGCGLAIIALYCYLQRDSSNKTRS